MPAVDPVLKKTRHREASQSPRQVTQRTAPPRQADQGDTDRSRPAPTPARQARTRPLSGDAPQTRAVDTTRANAYKSTATYLAQVQAARATRAARLRQGILQGFQRESAAQAQAREDQNARSLLRFHPASDEPRSNAELVRALQTGQRPTRVGGQALRARQQEARLAPVLGVLNQSTRPLHAIAGAADAAIQGRNVPRAALRGIENKDKTTFSDVLKHAGIHNPIVKGVVGFGLDIALDPTTYATFGVGSVASKAAAKAATDAEKKALAAGLTAEQAKRFGQRASAQALKNASQARGATVRFAGNEVPGIREATARAGAAAQRGVELVKPARAIRDAARHVAADFNPNIIPDGADRATYDAIRGATRTARSTASREIYKVRQQAAAVNRAIGDRNYRAVLDAIESGKVGALEAHLQKPALFLRDRFKYARRIEKQAGIRGGTRANYVPHLRQDLAEEGKGIGSSKVGSRTVRPSSSRARTDARSLAEIRKTDPGKYIEDPGVLHAARLSEGAVARSKAELNRRLGDIGRRLQPGKVADLKHGEAAYLIRGSDIKKLEGKDLERALDRAPLRTYSLGSRGAVAGRAEELRQRARDIDEELQQIAHRRSRLIGAQGVKRGQEAQTAPLRAYYVGASRFETRAAAKAFLKNGGGPAAGQDIAYNGGFGVKSVMQNLVDLAKVRSVSIPPSRKFGTTGTHRMSDAQVAALDRRLQANGFHRVSNADGSTVWKKQAVKAQPGGNIRIVARSRSEAKRIGQIAQLERLGRARNAAKKAALAEARKLDDELKGGVAPRAGGQVVALNEQAVDRALKTMTPGGERSAIGAGLDKVQGTWKLLATQPNPGFHVRNFIGDLQNAYLGQNAGRLAGNLGHSAKALTELGRQEKALKTVDLVGSRIDPAGKGLKIGGQHMSYSQLIAEAEKSGGVRSGFVSRELHDLIQGNAGREANGRFSGPRRWLQNREDVIRLATYIGARQQGKTAEQAAAYVAKHHFDYSDLTEIERKVMRRVMPFYTFSARNIPLQFKALVANPGKYAAYEKVREELAKSFGYKDGWEGDLSESEQRGAPFPIKINGRKYTISLGPSGLPLTDLNEFPTSKNPLKQADEWIDRAMSLLTPAVKTPVEMWSNFSFFFRDQISKDDAPLVPVSSLVAGAIPAKYRKQMGFTNQYVDKRTGKKQWAAPAKVVYAMGVLPGPAGFLNRLTTSSERAGQSTANKLVGYVGPRVRPIDKQTTQINNLYQQRAGIDKKMRALNQQGVNADSATAEYAKLQAQEQDLTGHIMALKTLRGDVMPGSPGVEVADDQAPSRPTSTRTAAPHVGIPASVRQALHAAHGGGTHVGIPESVRRALHAAHAG